MPQLTSPRLPGVPLLLPFSSGAEYSRWRRSIKFALETKDSWKYCNGKCVMPMPEAGPNFMPPGTSTTKLQPTLLEERRDWVRHDREVKLDIFLSLSEEVMLEVFEVGPPLPPSNYNAQEMLEALDENFTDFKFEAYHHAFCHFMNLHIDQYPSIQEFNQEFSATLEDLLDHGHPLSNVQACSAYFSKLRCTQNPWVSKKLEEFDAQPEDIAITDLLQESPPWSVIRPLAPKISMNFHTESIPEEYLEDSSASDSDAASEPSDASTVSSASTHSRQNSNTSLNIIPQQETSVERQLSTITAHSQEITIHASSEAIAEIEPQALVKELEKLPTSIIPERGSSKNQVPGTNLRDETEKIPSAVPEWLASKKSVARRPLPSPHNRPLPPLPSQAFQSSEDESGSRSASPASLDTSSRTSSLTSLTIPTRPIQLAPTSHPAVQLSALKLETVHPTLRPVSPTPAPAELHPALRTLLHPEQLSSHPAIASAALASLHRLAVETTPTFNPLRRPSASSPNLAIPWPSTPDIAPRPHSSRANLPFTQTPNPHPSQAPSQPQTPPQSFVDDDVPASRLRPRFPRLDSNGSEISLPLQGTRDSAWEYLYEAKGGYLIQSPPPVPRLPREHSLPPVMRAPTFDSDTIISRTSRSVSPAFMGHGKSSSLDFVSRLSGDSVFENSEVGRDRERRFRKKRGWSVNVNLARFSASKGVKEMI